MNPEEVYISQVLAKLPDGTLRDQIAMELRSHIADRVERGSSVEEAIRQLGDPSVLAESYLAAVPLVSAPLGPRAAAKVIDVFIIVAVPLAVLMLGFLFESAGMLGEPLERPLLAIAFLLAVFGSSLYPLIAEYRTGQTLGKRLFGLRVVTETGARISLGQSFLRQLPLYLQFFVVDAVFALFTEKKQRAFEMISKTRVVVAQEARHRGGVTEGTVAAL